MNMNVITTINNPYLKITNVSLNLINGNEKDLKIYGNISIFKECLDLSDVSPTIVLDVINNDDNIVYSKRVNPFDGILVYDDIENSFTITIVNYSRFFELPVKEFKLYTILQKN